MNREQLHNAPDEELCRLAQLGEPYAEETLVLRYSKMVRGLSRPLFLIGGDMEDLNQEGLLGLMFAIREFVPTVGTVFSQFAYICVKRRLYSAVRDANRYKHAPLSVFVPLEDVDSLSASANALDPESLVISREEADEHRNALNGLLSDLEGSILGMYLEGLSYSEIAEKLHKSPKSVDNAVQRIRRKLHSIVR